MKKFLNRSNKVKGPSSAVGKEVLQDDSIIGMEMHMDAGTEVSSITCAHANETFHPNAKYGRGIGNGYRHERGAISKQNVNHTTKEHNGLLDHMSMFSQSTKFGVSGGRLMKCIASREWGEVLSYMAISMSHAATANYDHDAYENSDSKAHQILVKESSVWSRAPLLSHDSIPQMILPIHLACVLKPPKDVICALLHAYPPGVAAPEPDTGKLPIHLAIMRDASSEVIQTLCQSYPTGLRTRDNEGRFPIHYAVIWSDREICELILRLYPSGVRAVDATERTPVELAQLSGNPYKNEVLDVLKEYSIPSKAYANAGKARGTNGTQSLDQTQFHEETSFSREDATDFYNSLTESATPYSDENILITATAKGSKKYSKHLSTNEYEQNKSGNIDGIISQIVRHRSIIIDEEIDLSNNSKSMERAKHNIEKVRKSKEVHRTNIDFIEKKIVEHDKVVEEAMNEIEKLKSLVQREKKMIALQRGKIHKEQEKIEDIEKREKEINNDIESLAKRMSNNQNVINEVTLTIANLETQISNSHRQ